MKINYDINTDHHDEPDMDLKVVYRNGKKVWPPEDPVDIHDEISAGFSRIEKAIREESAKMAEIIREAIAEKNPPVYIPQFSRPEDINYIPSYTISTIPEACKNCSNHPSNGGTGICHCTLGSPSVTCNSTDCSWR